MFCLEKKLRIKKYKKYTVYYCFEIRKRNKAIYNVHKMHEKKGIFKEGTCFDWFPMGPLKKNSNKRNKKHFNIVFFKIDY